MRKSKSSPESKSAPPRLITLGRCALTRASDSEILLGAGKPLALLCYLAFSPRRTASREHLIDLLWSDAELDRSRHVLRQTLWYIRQATDDEIVTGEGADLRLRDDVTTDRDEFLRAVDEGALDRAVSLYPGDFLPGLSVPGGAAFDQWADVERFRLRAAFLRSGAALVRQQLTTGHAREALPLARRLRDAFPLNEQNWRLLLETHLAAADPVGAALEADAFEQLLNGEKRVPEPASRSMLHAARRTPAEAPAVEHGLVSELIGREREFAQIVQSWEQAVRGRGGHVHVVSPAGFGKTRLLTEVQTRLRAGGARVVSLRAVSGERHLAGGFVGELARTLASLPGAAGVSPSAAGTLVALHPAVSSFYTSAPDLATGDDALRRRTAALAELVAAVADEGSLALILDDLHWADPQSRAVLTGMSARLAKEPVLLLTSARSASGADASPPDTARLLLEALTAPNVRALLASIARLPDDPWVDPTVRALHNAAAGCPLLVLETLQLALERGLLALSDGAWTCGEPEALMRQLRSGSALRHRIAALDRASAWVLVLLGVAGTPLSLDQLAGLTRHPPAEVEAVLSQLEVRGMVSRAGELWLPGHDEIGALAVEIAPPVAVKAAEKKLGLMWLAEAEWQPTLLLRAAPLLAAAEEWGALERAFGVWVRRARSRGDYRPPTELGAELVSADLDARLLRRLGRSLPIQYRVGLDRPSRIAAAGALILLTGTGAALSLRTQPPPDVELVAYFARTHQPAWVRSAPLRRAQWEDVRAVKPGSARPWLTLDPGSTNPHQNRAGDWVYARNVSDSGTIDVFLGKGDGTERRLSYTPGDDGEPAWAPDGSVIIFSSARWSPLSHYNLGILDPNTRAVRRLTATNATDHVGGWSPEGTRIAYLRRYWSGRPPALCWTTPDGLRTKCRSVDRGTEGFVGWLDAHRIVMLSGTPQGGVVTAADVDGGREDTLATGAIRASLSPDGEWLATWVSRNGGYEWMVRPLDAPDQSRPVELGNDSSRSVIEWRSLPGRARRWLSLLTVKVPGDTAGIGVPLRLEVSGSDPDGRPVDLPVLEFQSLDPEIATIDSNGMLIPRKSGTARVIVSAGGWRTDSIRVPVAVAAARVILATDWSDSLRGFVPFGQPLPAVIAVPGRGHAFWNAGDSSYPSGVYAHDWLGASRGLGVEASVSVPITLEQWQALTMSLTSAVDSAELAGWDHRSDVIPASRESPGAWCEWGVPMGEGLPAVEQVAMSAGLAVDTLTRRNLLNGTWHRFRIQIFPDGRCGMALDGRAVGILNSALPTGARYLLVLQGKSVRTRVLVGPIVVWEGVRTDVNWTRVAPTP